jgi:hypothetical protein
MTPVWNTIALLVCDFVWGVDRVREWRRAS